MACATTSVTIQFAAAMTSATRYIVAAATGNSILRCRNYLSHHICDTAHLLIRHNVGIQLYSHHYIFCRAPFHNRRKVYKLPSHCRQFRVGVPIKPAVNTVITTSPVSSLHLGQGFRGMKVLLYCVWDPGLKVN